jgi:hypothetical protein
MTAPKPLTEEDLAELRAEHAHAFDKGLGYTASDLPAMWLRAVLATIDADRARIAELTAELAAERSCGTCGGDGKTTHGGPCACNGTGLASVERDTLRRAALDVDGRLAEMDALQDVAKAAEHVLRKHGDDYEVMHAPLTDALAKLDALRKGL